jgi:hypothetical protein
MGIKTNDKLAIIGWEQKNEAYCISLIKAEKLHKMVRVLLGSYDGAIKQKMIKKTFLGE